jgi:tryptophan synthase alpha chain
MNRIAEKFASLKADEKKGFIPFITAGDPDLDTTLNIMLKLVEHGADIIELGVPFSDPMADGPTIQRSSQRALKHDVNLNDIFETVKRLRSRTDAPIVLFSYLNPLFRYGLEKLAVDAASAGIDGVLVTDVVGNEAEKIANTLSAKGLDLISLVAPTTSDERLECITVASSGFIYAVSRAGVTGTRVEASTDAETLVNRIRKFTGLPVAVGFGISTRAQIEEVWRYADAAVVGSAIVAEIERCNGKDVISALDGFLNDLLPNERQSGS